MKIILLIGCISIFLTGCGYVDKAIAHATGYSEICIGNVTYLQFTSGATVKVDLSGKPVQCK